MPVWLTWEQRQVSCRPCQRWVTLLVGGRSLGDNDVIKPSRLYRAGGCGAHEIMKWHFLCGCECGSACESVCRSAFVCASTQGRLVRISLRLIDDIYAHILPFSAFPPRLLPPSLDNLLVKQQTELGYHTLCASVFKFFPWRGRFGGWMSLMCT